jgi:hypothetical protein
MRSLILFAVLLLPSLGFAAVPTTSIDIGQVGAAGSTTATSGVYAVQASGADIWWSQDEFRFFYASLSGDGEITARVDSLTGPDTWTKAGVMIRESLATNSRFAFTVLSRGSGVDFHYRETTGGMAGPSGTSDGVSRAPYWVRLRRAGNVFTAYVSANGSVWRQHGNSTTVAMGATVYAGLAVTSHADGTLATANFSNVSINATSAPPPPAPQPTPQLTTSADIGGVGAAGSTSTANGIYTVRASGADIWGTQDEFRYVYASLNGDGQITARVDSLAAPDGWTKAGVMIRETLSPSSRFAYTLVTGNNGVDFEYRETTAGSAGPPGMFDRVSRAPYWVRLRRAGNVFTAHVSADGVTWRQQGSSITIAMGTTVYAGLAVTSHLDGQLATAVFSNVTLGASSPPSGNRPPTISGTPSGSVTVGTQYAFTPTASDPDGNALTYSIQNRPTWATFNTTTGRLSGTPTSANLGNYVNIVISVSDGLASAQLPAFAVNVTAMANRPPVISGTPPTSATQGVAYSFQPTASDPDGNTLTFSVSNAPTWLTLNTTTGRLQGTPGSSNVGTFSNIVLRVSDGQATAQLPAFAIVVSAAANRAPLISGTPPTSVMAGSSYSFQPTASDPDGDTLTFSITNPPPWATFSTTTGRLQGTPTAANVGTYGNIAIRVSDGRTTTSLASFAITVVATASGSATLSWTPPTTNNNGSPLTNLAGYRVYWGNSPTGMTQSVSLNNPGLSSYVIGNLVAGTYYFGVKAVSSTGVESTMSNVGTKTIQ